MKSILLDNCCILFGIMKAKLMTLKDSRLKLIQQIMSGIKVSFMCDIPKRVIITENQYFQKVFFQVLKLYAWEPYFEDRLKSIRRKEFEVLRKVNMMIGGSYGVWMSAPFLVL